MKAFFSFNYEGKFDYGNDFILFFMLFKYLDACCFMPEDVTETSDDGASHVIDKIEAFNESGFISGGVLL